jgi:hypothetical protein
VDCLDENGPLSLSKIAKVIKHSIQLTRYALQLLREDRRVFISEYIRPDEDVFGEKRMMSIYCLGDDDDVKLEEGLDFGSTQHLQSIYIEWSQTRTPDYEMDHVPRLRW